MKKVTATVSGHTPTEAAQARTVKHGVSRLMPYVPPWLVWLASLGVAAVCWHLWGANPNVRPWAACGVQLMCGLWIYVTYKAAKPLGEVVRVLATLGIMVTSLFMVVSTIVSPWVRPVIDLWGGIGGGVCIAWTIYRLLMARAAGETIPGSGAAQRIFDALNGAKTGNVKVLESGQIEIPYEVNRGYQSQEDMKVAAEAINYVTGLRPNAARRVPSKTDAGAGKFVFSPVDILTGDIPWQGPLFVGKSIHDGVPLGMFENHSRVHVFLTADKKTGRNAAQWLIMGMNGSGKSYLMVLLVADALTRKDVTVWAHDHVKGLQTLKPILEGGGLDWVSMDLKSGKHMLSEAERVIQARARYLGANDFEEWTPDCGLNLLIVWIEEATALASLGKLTDLVRTGRSVGVVIFISLQRASHVSMSTETRAQLSGNICLGVESSQDAAFCLPDHVRDAGAEPERWRNEKQGYFYISAPGIDEELQATPAKTFRIEREQIVNTVKLGNEFRQPLDKVSQDACSPIYHKRIDAAAYLPGHPLFDEVVMGLKPANAEPSNNETPNDESDNVESQKADDDPDEMEEEEDEKLMNDMRQQFKNPEPIEPCPVPEMPIGDPDMRREEKADVSAKRIQDFLKARVDAGAFEISAPDLKAMRPPVLCGREWLRQHLKSLCGEDADVRGYRLTRDDDDPPGTYTIVAPNIA